jgi:hypothetical protein
VETRGATVERMTIQRMDHVGTIVELAERIGRAG